MRERNRYIDDLKGWGILLMLLGHSMNFSIGSGNILWHTIYSFHMPMFFVISGLLISDRGVDIKKLAHKVLVPYVGIGVIIVILLYIKSGSWKNYLLSVCVGKTYDPMLGYDWHPAVGPIWFLMCFFMAHLYHNVMNKLSIRWKWIVLIVAFELSLWFARTFGKLPYLALEGFAGALFIQIGQMLKVEKIKRCLNTWWSFLIGLLIVVLCVWKGNLIMSSHIYKLNLLQVVGAAYATWFLYQIVKFIPNNWVEFIGKMSLWILCVHTIDYRLGVSASLVRHFVTNSYVSCGCIFVSELLFAVSGVLLWQFCNQKFNMLVTKYYHD